MALSDQKKNRYRHVIRTSMIAIAVFLLVVAVAIPFINNAIALSEENYLKALPLPDGARLVSSVSAAGNLSGIHNGMQYYGAILVESDCSLEQITQHYSQHRRYPMDCMVADAASARIMLEGMPLAEIEPAFDKAAVEDDWYLIYSWGDPPDWLWDILNLDSRSR